MERPVHAPHLRVSAMRPPGGVLRVPEPDEGFIDRSLFPNPFRFVIGYHEEPDFIGRLLPYREYIDAVYLPLPPRFMGSGRPWEGSDAATWEASLPGRVRAAKDQGIEPEVICNAMLPDWSKVPEVLRYLDRLVDAGLRYVTVAFLPLAAAIKKRHPSVEIKASTIAFIHDNVRLERWVEAADVRMVVPDRSITKDLPALKRLRRSGVELTLVMDDVCLPSCPIQFQHYLLLGEAGECPGRDVRSGLEVIDSNCGSYERENTWRIFQYYVVPADLPRYAGIVRGLKLGRGRTATADHVIREMRHYMDTRLRTHFYLGYYEPPETWGRLEACDRVCRKCGWCPKAFDEWNEPSELAEEHGATLWRPRDPALDSPYKP